MAEFQQVWVHDSCRLSKWSELRLQSLKSGNLYHGFHYQSLQQGKLWLKVFQKYSPAASEHVAAPVYQSLAEQIPRFVSSASPYLISLGCGDGSKDLVLLKSLHKLGFQTLWTPQDISLALVLHSVDGAQGLPLKGIQPLVGNLESIPDLAEQLHRIDRVAPRIFTFFGLVPNFEPEFILNFWKQILRPGDHLLVSANLSPGGDASKNDYLKATQLILPQYDNPETEEWLRTIIGDWGLTKRLEGFRFRLESRQDFLRIVAAMNWRDDLVMEWEGEELSFRKGESFRLFFSYRYTPVRFRQLVGKAGLSIRWEGFSPSGEEGVWWLSA